MANTNANASDTVTIAIVTALPKEEAAMRLLLDDAMPLSTGGRSPGEYTVGTIPSKDGRRHHVVLALSSVGENLAAATAATLIERFPNIRQVVMCGIAGAVPNPEKAEHDVRLGDIVVSNGDGVIQYDNVRDSRRAGRQSSSPRHPPRPPSARLLIAMRELQSLELTGAKPWKDHLPRFAELTWATRPPASTDVLHETKNPEIEVRRIDDPEREAGFPKVFEGPIASANTLLKNAKRRDKLREQFGVKAAEMEASGIADATWLPQVGYFVVRGTCDYCDEFKNDVWQGYAAVIAATYVRALLEQTRSETPELDASSDEDWDRIRAISGTYSGLVSTSIGGHHLERQDVETRLAASVQRYPITALIGPSGAGKSAIAKVYFEESSPSNQRLWLNASLLGHPSGLATQLSLSRPLNEVLKRVKPTLAVIDGVDRLYADGEIIALVALIHEISKLDACHVILTCQNQDWPRVYSALRLKGLKIPANSVDCPTPTASEVTALWSSCPPVTRAMVGNQRLAAVLANLKILDVVISHIELGGDIQNWVSEADIANWYWSAIVAVGENRRPKEKVVRQIAQLQADRLVWAIPIDEFDVSAITVIGDLESCSVVHVDPTTSKVSFAHDLLGDWARLRILMQNEGEPLPDLVSKVGSPLWHRAIRLYGSQLLDKPNSEALWRKFTVSPTPSEIIDLMTQSLIFAPNPYRSLLMVHPHLIEHPHLLRRLLVQLLTYATKITPSFQQILDDNGIDFTQADDDYRTPQHFLWLPFLQLMVLHSDSVSDCAPNETARIVIMWMQTTSGDSVYRGELADIGLKLGEIARAQRLKKRRRQWDYYSRDAADRALLYKAALCGIRERAEEVCLFLRRLSERVVDDSDFVTDDDVTTSQALVFREMREAWPIGPRQAVDPDFSDLVWSDRGTLIQVMAVAPDVAAEAVLATLIEAPRTISHYRDLGELHIVRSLKHRSPEIYFDGPFSVLLRVDFEATAKMICTFVDFATQRLSDYVTLQSEIDKVDRPSRGKQIIDLDSFYRPLESISLFFEDGNQKTYIGDERVYGWNAGIGFIPPPPVNVALMALEEHLYEAIERGEDVASRVRLLLDQSQSVAMLGLLVDVGKKSKGLFLDVLSPLLGCAQIYSWDTQRMVKGRQQFSMFAFTRGEWAAQKSEGFHARRHRSIDLRVLGGILYYSEATSSLATQMDQAIRRWVGDASEDDLPHPLQVLIAHYRREYYQTQVVDDDEILTNTRLLELNQKNVEQNAALKRKLLGVHLPITCRQLLDAGAPLSVSELFELHALLKQLGDPPDPSAAADDDAEDAARKWAAATCGVAAVVLLLGETSEDELRSWAVRVLLETTHAPPPASRYDMPESVSIADWRLFAARALPVLWANDPTNSQRRAAVAKLATHWHVATVAELFGHCARVRGKLAEHFVQLLTLAAYCSHARALMESTLAAVKRSIGETLDRLCTAFADATMPSIAVGENWHVITPTYDFSMLKEPVGLAWYRFKYFRAIFEWLPPLAETLDAEERDRCLRLLRDTMQVLPLSPRDHRVPNDDENWFLAKLASALLDMSDAEDPAWFWNRVIEIQGGQDHESHHWAEWFFKYLNRTGLSQPRRSTRLASLQVEMGTKLLTDAERNEGWSPHDSAWVELLGLDEFAITRWSEQHRDIVRRNADLTRRWVEFAGRDASNLRRFCVWLLREAARDIREEALVWIDEVLAAHHGRRLREELQAALANLLGELWKQPISLRRHDRSFRAFKTILGRLVAEELPAAMLLSKKIGEGEGDSSAGTN